MKFATTAGISAILMVAAAAALQLAAMVSAADYPKAETVWCAKTSRCSDAYVDCPAECASTTTPNAKGKRKPNCDAPGSACYDPRFVGGDGRVFYFHGKTNEVFTLVSDPNFQINGRFIGHRPAGRPRDFTWIQSLGVLFNTHKFTLEATKAATWDSEADHLKFAYNGQDISITEGSLSSWYSQDKDIKVERVSSKNSVIISIRDKAEILVNVVPVTKEDDRVHKYNVPQHDCFVHLEVQFRFYKLSPRVEGVLGRTYQPDFENTVARPGVAMPVMGGEDKYRTSDLVSAECGACIFSEAEELKKQGNVVDFPTLDCTRGAAAGYGIVCRK
ncbi:unnamed protein product [Linum tenue]|uniref:Root cap n=1 Tax=Linum tenue TaxID=586396 RepID=A0AAV0GSS1_9ROSI|nr:unnamed protein product [Linum tenue]